MKVIFLVAKSAYKLSFFSLLLCIANNSHSQPTANPFTFTGTVTGMPDGYVYLSYIDSANHYIRDSSALKKGRFSFTGYISSPHQAELATAAANGAPDHSQFTYLFVAEGKMQGTFAATDFKNNNLTGAKSITEYTLYQQQEQELRQKWKLALTAQQAYNEGVNKEKNYVIWNKAAPQFQKEKGQMDQRFIRQHPQSYVSACLLRGALFKLPFDSLKFYYTLLAPAVRTGTEGSIIGAFIRKEESIAAGKPAPDFMQPDSSGAPVWLHTFKGQYILLDVWASWCKPCREEHPYLRQAYQHYQQKGFTILSLSMDRAEDKQAWLAAIRKDSLTWPQVCDFTAWQNKVIDKYNVLGKGIPANFLINPQGIIVAMNLRGEALEKKLAELIPEP